MQKVSLHVQDINKNDPELKEKLKAIAVKRGVTMSDIVVGLVEDYVSAVEKEEEFI